MSMQLFIPEKLRIGFQNRSDTYTQKLAYVVYYDQKGVLRKEKSWEGWRDKKIQPKDFVNEPTEGFVLNKGVGGARRSYGWNVRNEYIRVYDPRDFEFEISIANLLFILRECDCSKGKGLEGKFVYAWEGTELVLLPTISDDYQQCRRFTDLQTQGVKSKELIQGASYTTKKLETLTYLGRFDYHAIVVKQQYHKSDPAVSQKYVFWDGKWFVFMKDLKQIAVLNSETVAPDYAELVDKFHKSTNGSKVVKLFLKDARKRKPQSGRADEWCYEQSPGVFVECTTTYDYGKIPKISYVTMRGQVSLKNDAVSVDSYYATAYPPNVAHSRWQNDQIAKWVEPTGQHLWALLESGLEFRYSYHKLVERDKPEETYDGEEGDN